MKIKVSYFSYKGSFYEFGTFELIGNITHTDGVYNFRTTEGIKYFPTHNIIIEEIK